MTVEIKIDTAKFTAKMADLRKVTNQAMPAIYSEFVRNTPVAAVRGGNARDNTTYHSNVIQANYPYAVVLDAGRGYRDGQMRGSDQAPHGMTEPTRQFAKRLIPQIVQRIGRK